MSRLRASWLPAVVITLVAGLAVVLTPVPWALAVRSWMVGLGMVIATALIGTSLATHPRLVIPPVRLRRPAAGDVGRPPGLEEVERAIDFGSWNQSDLEHRLRPMLVEVAEHRLSSRRGIDYDRQPERARAVLGEDLWRLLNGDGPGAGGRGPGVPVGVLQSAIEALEAI
ncbi:MAG: hypothetical protein NVS9B1_11810 [Candidatus Dormibacteraceae bacterium]